MVCTNIFATNLLINKNVIVKVNIESLKIRATPFNKGKVLGIKARESELLIKGCNNYGWCELQEGGFVPNYTIRADNLLFNYKKEFNSNKNKKAISKSSSLKIFERPYYKSNILSNKESKNQIISINGCDDYGWCQIKKGGYIPSFLIKFISDDYKIDKNVKIEEVKINNLDKVQITKKIIHKIPIRIIKETNIKNKNRKKSKKKVNLNKYKLALQLYKAKRYINSYNKFNELFKENTNNVNINFYLGRSAFQIKKFDEALIAYERVLFEKPNALRTKYEMARTFFLLNDYKNSKKEFLLLKNNKKINKNLKIRIDKYLNTIENKTKKNYFKGALIFGLGHDSNINNSPSEDDYGQNINNATPRNNDYSHEEILSLIHTHKINDEKNIDNNFLIYSKNMFKYTEKDIIFLSYSPSLTIMHNNSLKVSYGIFIDNIHIDSKNYLSTYGINPTLI